MKAIRQHAYGGPERLVYEDAPSPDRQQASALRACTPPASRPRN